MLLSVHARAADPPRAEPSPRADQVRGYARKLGHGAGHALAYVPRLLLAVPRYAFRLVFWPTEKLLGFFDEHAVVAHVEDLLYNDARTAGIVPKLAIDSAFGLSLGAKVFDENLAGHGEFGSVESRFGGLYDSFSQLTFRANRFGGSRLWLESVTRYESKPNLIFEGIGHPHEQRGGSGLDPRAAAVETRFHERRFLGLLRSGYSFGAPGNLLQLGGTAVYNLRDFGPKTRGDDPSIETVYDTSKLVGFDDRVPVLEFDLNVVADTRDTPGATSRGTYFEAFAGRTPGLSSYEFWHTGAELVGYIDLYRRSRVLILRGAFEGVEGSSDEIPFSELPRLGGPNRLRGYRLDRFRDKKAVLGTIEYHYPIHQFISGSLYTDVGRVGPSYDDFLTSKGWRAGVGAGLIFRTHDRLNFSVDVAYGDGLQIYFTTDPLRAFSRRDTEL